MFRSPHSSEKRRKTPGALKRTFSVPVAFATCVAHQAAISSMWSTVEPRMWMSISASFVLKPSISDKVKAGGDFRIEDEPLLCCFHYIVLYYNSKIGICSERNNFRQRQYLFAWARCTMPIAMPDSKMFTASCTTILPCQVSRVRKDLMCSHARKLTEGQKRPVFKTSGMDSIC